jgi:predicted nucleic acid-binding protein
VLLLDTSAWSHLGQGRVAEDRVEVIAAWMSDGEIATCLPFLLEAGYSARSAPGHQAMMADFARLPRMEITPEVERRALGAQHELALAGRHRLAPSDVMIAACAHVAGMGVLHYDRDYDVLAEYTSLSFDSEWLANPGSL